MDMLVFIYMNIRALRQASGAQDWDKERWKELLEDILLNIEDEVVKTEQEDDSEE